MFTIHLLISYPSNNIKVLVGSSRCNESDTIVRLKDANQHMEYVSKTFDYDFALLQLNETLQFDGRINAIALPDDNETIADGTECTVSGWGYTLNIFQSTIDLRRTDVSIVNQTKCLDEMVDLHPITDRMICAGYEKSGNLKLKIAKKKIIPDSICIFPVK